MLDGGKVLKVSNVIWCTGFTPNYDWIDVSIATDNGVPVTTAESSCPVPVCTSSGFSSVIAERL